jgi:hypothetical protein
VTAIGPAQNTIVSNAYSVTLSPVGAFATKNLTGVTIPASVNAIGKYAFANNQLTTIIIPSSVTSIGYAAFAGNQLSSVIIPDSLTDIDSTAFDGNPQISFIRSNAATSGNSPVAQAETGVDSGSTAANPASDFVWVVNNDGTVTIMEYVGKATTVVIPAVIEGRAVTAIGDAQDINHLDYKGAFEGKELSSVTIPNTVKSIGGNAFARNLLTGVTIPNSVINI